MEFTINPVLSSINIALSPKTSSCTIFRALCTLQAQMRGFCRDCGLRWAPNRNPSSAICFKFIVLEAIESIATRRRYSTTRWAQSSAVVSLLCFATTTSAVMFVDIWFDEHMTIVLIHIPKLTKQRLFLRFAFALQNDKPFSFRFNLICAN